MKRYASKGKFLYCAELNIYCIATTDTEHEWIEIDKEEVKDGD